MICSTTKILYKGVSLFCPQIGLACQHDRPGHFGRSVGGQERTIRLVVV